jgi:hypothetical protein
MFSLIHFQGNSGEAGRSQQEPGAKGSQEEPGARRSYEEPARRPRRPRQESAIASQEAQKDRAGLRRSQEDSGDPAEAKHICLISQNKLAGSA